MVICSLAVALSALSSACQNKGMAMPLSEEVQARYDQSKEHTREPNYPLEMKLRELKRFL